MKMYRCISCRLSILLSLLSRLFLALSISLVSFISQLAFAADIVTNNSTISGTAIFSTAVPTTEQSTEENQDTVTAKKSESRPNGNRYNKNKETLRVDPKSDVFTTIDNCIAHCAPDEDSIKNKKLQSISFRSLNPMRRYDEEFTFTCENNESESTPCQKDPAFSMGESFCEKQNLKLETISCIDIKALKKSGVEFKSEKDKKDE